MAERLVALVTGASSGIGESAARHLEAAGFVVYAGARRVDRMGGLADRGINVVALDVTDDTSMVAVVEQVVAEQGRIDVLINDAGYASYGAVEDVPMAEARRQLEVNVIGLARLCQLTLPYLRAAGRGRIVNISSIGGHFGEPLGAWYHASKFAVEGFSDSLRLEVQPFGIDVVVIEPGAILTEWGGIAVESAERYSGSGPYAPQVGGMRAVYAAADRSGTDPEVIGAVIARAATVKRPRTRYAAPWSAKLLIAATKVLPDRALDRTIRTAYRPRD